jgi:glutathione S-transferase
LITVYVDGYFVSPLDATCLIALDEKRLEYQTARALLRDGQGVPAALGNRSLIARVPALQHGELFLSESLAIVDYLETAFPPPEYPRLFPADPRTRARAWQVMSYLRFDLHALREERQWWTCVYSCTELLPLSARALRETDELISIASRFVGELGDWNLAHADLAMQLLRLSRNGFPMPDPLLAFIEATCARPSVRAYIDHARPPNPPPRPSALG